MSPRQNGSLLKSDRYLTGEYLEGVGCSSVVPSSTLSISVRVKQSQSPPRTHSSSYNRTMVFGIGGGSRQAPAVGPSGISPQVEAATAELDMITEIFNNLVSSCHSKCISTRYLEGDLNKGESVCIDRCVGKFFAVNQKVSDKMRDLNSQAQGGAGGGSGGSFF
ncbi:unnamed protein product [Sympodiomycopsis kandeliae]